MGEVQILQVFCVSPFYACFLIAWPACCFSLAYLPVCGKSDIYHRGVQILQFFCGSLPYTSSAHLPYTANKMNSQLMKLFVVNLFLHSSPHLVNIEERIRINGKPISRDHFASVFWSVHDTLKEFTVSICFDVNFKQSNKSDKSVFALHHKLTSVREPMAIGSDRVPVAEWSISSPPCNRKVLGSNPVSG
ncbi:unnamed protein product [Trichobilharzia regenti]|nr:unnamed protein product [Trichobilharzia regenti]